MTCKITSRIKHLGEVLDIGPDKAGQIISQEMGCEGVKSVYAPKRLATMLSKDCNPSFLQILGDGRRVHNARTVPFTGLVGPDYATTFGRSINNALLGFPPNKISEIRPTYFWMECSSRAASWDGVRYGLVYGGYRGAL